MAIEGMTTYDEQCDKTELEEHDAENDRTAQAFQLAQKILDLPLEDQLRVAVMVEERFANDLQSVTSRVLKRVAPRRTVQVSHIVWRHTPLEDELGSRIPQAEWHLCLFVGESTVIAHHGTYASSQELIEALDAHLAGEASGTV